MKFPFPTKQYGALVDISTNIVLLILQIDLGNYLSECMPNTKTVYGINFPNYYSVRGLFFLEHLNLGNFVTWSWDTANRKIVKTNPELITEEIRLRSRLADRKYSALNKMRTHLNRVRAEGVPGLFFQDSIYILKRQQAQMFKDSGYDEKKGVYTYVEQYARLKKISQKEAADEILFKAQLSDEHIAKTEWLRLKYFNLVRGAKYTEELDQIVNDFVHDCHFK